MFHEVNVVAAVQWVGFTTWINLDSPGCICHGKSEFVSVWVQLY